MMLVDRDAVERKLATKLQFVEIAIVERVAANGIEMTVGQDDPRAAVLILHAQVEIGVRHQMEHHDLHRGLLSAV
jgi:hypothetical protein